MDSIIQDFMAKNELPGISIAIARDDRLVCAKGYGLADTAEGTPVDVRSRFRIASISKPITAVTIFRLIEQGELNLTDQVFGVDGVLGTTYGSRPYRQHIEEITIDHLLTHTAGGWKNDESDPMFTNPAMNHAELISWTMDNCELVDRPGVSYAYSNFGYCVLGRIIEKRTGMPYDEATRQLVLGPCGIADMAIAGNTEAQRQPNEVVYYGQPDQDPYTMEVARMDSHGGWIASAIDLTRFAVRVNGSPGKPDILSAETIATMAAGSTANAGYARGWAVNADGNWWHGGSLPGTATILVRAASGYCWAALTNTRRPDLGAELDQMVWSVVRSISDWPDQDLF